MCLFFSLLLLSNVLLCDFLTISVRTFTILLVCNHLDHMDTKNSILRKLK